MEDETTLQIVWAKYHRRIFWPAEIIEEEVDGQKVKFLHFFVENEWKRLSSKGVKVACWECSEKDDFMKAGERLQNKGRCLSFKNAVKEAEVHFKVTKDFEERDTESSTNEKCSFGKLDEDNFEDDDDFPVAFSPIRKTPENMAKGDVIWAKYKKDPYWPGIFHSIEKRKKKRPKVWVYFFDENWKIKEMKRIIVAVGIENVLPFCCVEETKKQILKEGSLSDLNFSQSVSFAEEYLADKASGKITDFFEYESENDSDSDISLEFPRSTPKKRKIIDQEEQNTPTRTPTKFKDLVTGRSWKTTAPQQQKQLLNAIDKTRPILEKILREEVECERHTIFTKGTTNEKNMLKHKSGYGPIDDDKVAEKILEKLLNWFHKCKKKKHFNSVTYVSDVWLPEAIILGLMDSRKIGRSAAEKIFINNK